MAEKNEKIPFWNKGIVGLAMVFTIPALLTIGGMLLAARYGRIPGGTTTTCERAFDGVTIHLERYRYMAGLTPYETRTFSVSRKDADTMKVFEVTFLASQEDTCEGAIQQPGDNAILLTTQKGIAISQDGGATWHIHKVCDAPRPTSGHCDDAPLYYVSVTFDNPQQGQVFVHNVITDDYGIPVLDENGQRQINNTYILETNDGGVTWALAND